MKKKSIIKIIIVSIMIAIFIVFWQLDIFANFKLERIVYLIDWINSFGLIAPIIFIVTYIVATVFFLPGLPLTLLAGIVFGPIFGSVWVSIASTLGATMAFIVSRYLGRDSIVKRFSHLEIMKKIEEGVDSQGWKMVAITRLVPLFPFNLQNYIYGLTNISLPIYMFVSWLCMLPATIGYTFLAGAIIDGEGDVGKTITYLGIGIALIIMISLVGSFLGKTTAKKTAANKTTVEKDL